MFLLEFPMDEPDPTTVNPPCRHRLPVFAEQPAVV